MKLALFDSSTYELDFELKINKILKHKVYWEMVQNVFAERRVQLKLNSKYIKRFVLNSHFRKHNSFKLFPWDIE